jgi:hypothetical protein
MPDHQLAHDYLDSEQSSFEETNGIVSNKDDPTMPCSSVRSWLLGLLAMGTCAFVRQYYFYRQPNYYLSATLMLLIALPIGKLFQRCSSGSHISSRITNRFLRIWNPARFSPKEHALIYTMAFIGSQVYISCELTVLTSAITDRSLSYGLGLAFVLSAELLGYGLAGDAFDRHATHGDFTCPPFLI